jgi:hypothetical protein
LRCYWFPSPSLGSAFSSVALLRFKFYKVIIPFTNYEGELCLYGE